MEVSVPISGVKPGCGPTTQAFSSAPVADARTGTEERPKAMPTPPFRKVRRLGVYSTGNIRCDLRGEWNLPENLTAGSPKKARYKARGRTRCGDETAVPVVPSPEFALPEGSGRAKGGAGNHSGNGFCSGRQSKAHHGSCYLQDLKSPIGRRSCLNALKAWNHHGSGLFAPHRYQWKRKARNENPSYVCIGSSPCRLRRKFRLRECSPGKSGSRR